MKKTVNLFQIAKERTTKIKISESFERKKSQNKDPLDLSSIVDRRRIINNEISSKSQIGLSTLLDFSVTTVRTSTKQRINMERDILDKGKQKIDEQIEEMRQKLKKIQQKPLILRTDQKDIYGSLNKNKDSRNDKKHYQFVLNIKNQLFKSKINKFVSMIAKIFKAKTLKRMFVLQQIHKIQQKRNLNVKNRVFMSWKKISMYEEERKIVMEAIRNRLIQRRKNNNLLSSLN